MSTINPNNPIIPPQQPIVPAPAPAPAPEQTAEVPAEGADAGEPVVSDGSAPAAESGGTEATGEKTATVAPTASEEKALNDLGISKKLMDELGSKGTQALIDGILADGKVDGADKTMLKQLRARLETAAKLDDGKIDSAEDSLIDALDSTGWFGTNEEVVKQNLTNISTKLKSSNANPNEVDFGINIITQDGVGGFFGGRQEKVLKLRDSEFGNGNTSYIPDETSATTPTPDDVTPPTQTGDTTAPTQTTPVPPVTEVTQNPEIPPETQLLLTEAQEAQQEEIKSLQQNLNALGQSLSDPSKVDNSKLLADLQSMTESPEDVDPDYGYRVLSGMGMSNEDLESIGVVKQTGEGNYEVDPEGLHKFLGDTTFTAQDAENYRGYLNNVIQKYQDNPSKENYNEVKQVLYDNSYVFESTEGISQAEFDAYYEVKQNLLSVEQKTTQLEAIKKSVVDGNYTLPQSSSSLSYKLESADSKASSELENFIADTKSFIDKAKANPEAFPGFDSTELEATLSELATFGENGEVTLKNPPPGQQELETVNKLWAEIERVGLANNLGDDFELANSIKDSTHPMANVLSKSPELLNYSHVFDTLNLPGNEKLKEAVLSGDEAKINQVFTEYYGQFFNSMASSFGSSFGGLLGFSPLLSMTSMFGQDNNLGFCSAGPISQTPSLSLGSTYLNPMSTGPFDVTGDLFNCEPPKLNLSGVNREEMLEFMSLISKGGPEAKALVGNGTNPIEQAVSEDPLLAKAQVQAETKSNFDNLFWESGSSLEKAQQAIAVRINQQEVFKAELKATAQAIESNLQNPDLSSELKTKLQSQLSAVNQAISDISQGKDINNSKALDEALKAVNTAKEINQSGIQESLSSVTQSQAKNAVKRDEYQPIIDDLKTSLNDGRFQNLIDRLPEEYRSILGGDPNNPNMSVRELERTMETLINSEDMSEEAKEASVQRLQVLQNLMAEANKEPFSADAFSQFANQPVAGVTPPGNSLDVMRDINKSIEYVSRIKNEIGSENLGKVSDGLYELSKEIQKSNPGISRDELYQEIEGHLPKIISRAKENIFWEDTNSLISVTQSEYQEAKKSLANSPSSEQVNDLVKQALTTIAKQEPKIAQNELTAMLDKGVDSLSGLNQEQLRNLQSEINNIQQNLATNSRLTDKEEISTQLSNYQKMIQYQIQYNDLASPTQARHQSEIQEGVHSIGGDIPVGAVGDVGAPQNAAGPDQVRGPRPPSHAQLEDTKKKSIAAASNLARDLGIPGSPQQITQQYMTFVEQNPNASLEDVLTHFGVNGRTGLDGMKANMFVQFMDQSLQASAAQRGEHPQGLAALQSAENVLLLGASSRLYAVIANPNSTEAQVTQAQSAMSQLNSAFAGDGPVNASSITSILESSGVNMNGWNGTVRHYERRKAELTESDNLREQEESIPEGDFSPSNVPSNPGDSPVIPEGDNGFMDIATVDDAANIVNTTPTVTNGGGSATVYTPGSPEITDAVETLDDNVERIIQTNPGQMTNILNGSVTRQREAIIETNEIMANAPPAQAREWARAIAPLMELANNNEIALTNAIAENNDIKSAALQRSGISQDAQKLMDKADQVAKLILNPEVENGPKAADLIKEFLDEIRDLDFKTRKIVMAYMAKQMLDNAITRFYKDKQDEMNEQHVKALERISENYKEQIERSLSEAASNSASDGQGVMAVSGMGIKNMGAAMSNISLQRDFAQMMDIAQAGGIMDGAQAKDIQKILFDNDKSNDSVGLFSLLNSFQIQAQVRGVSVN